MKTKISVEESCNRLDETWSPRVIATLNGHVPIRDCPI